MSDDKKSPDLKDVAATAGKLFHEIKSVVTKMVLDLKAKIPTNDAATPAHTAQPKEAENTTTHSCELPTKDKPTKKAKATETLQDEHDAKK